MTALGLLTGLLAAFFQACSYVFSRVFSCRFPGGIAPLLVTSHVIMAVFSVILLPFFLPVQMPEPRSFLVPLFGCSTAYFAGQACLFAALRKTHPSRVSPLLGLKIFMLGIVMTLFFNEIFSLWQWMAVVLSVVAALMLRSYGGKLAWSSLAWVLLACPGYCVSDIFIARLVPAFMSEGLLRATVFSVCLSYIVCGVYSLAVIKFIRIPSRRVWVYAFPFALTWYGGMLFLFACFALIGVVFGNIVQSTRGVLSILMGMALARAGFVQLEKKLTAATLVRRTFAAILMVIAIALFYLEP